MKENTLQEKYLKTLKNCKSTIGDLQILVEKEYCQFSANPSKDKRKELKKISMIMEKALTEIIKRKELNIV
jgi:hypothetical protein